MSENFDEAETHTAEAFLEFVMDFLEYAVTKYNYTWTRPGDVEREFLRIFRVTFGDAIILFRNRHEKEFAERMETDFKLICDADVEKYFDIFCERTFQGKIPLMELIVYFAFLLDISLWNLRRGRPEEVLLVTDLSFGVFVKYVERFFTIVGGWHALYRIADQYVDFVNSTPASIGSESVSEEMKQLIMKPF